MGDFATLLDAPAVAEAPADAGPLRSEHPIAKLGRYRDPRYGRFAITTKDFEGWQRNLNAAGRIPIDYDHQPERGGSTKAAGWITGIRLEADKVIASIEWTPEGAQAVRDRYYLFVSPTFTSHYRDEQGADRGPALIGVALTNRPFLRAGMPAISLSRVEAEGFADDEADGSEHHIQGGAIDVKPAPIPGPVPASATLTWTTSGTNVVPVIVAKRMDLTKLTEALGLDADADEAKVLDAITALKDQPEPEVKSLVEQAEAEGKIVLDAEAVAELNAKAQKGEDAAKQLAEMRFDTEFTKALDEGRVAPVEREHLEALYELDAEKTLTALAARPKIVNTEPQGSGGSEPVAPDNVDPDRFALDRQVQARMAERGEDYTTALDALLAEGVAI